MGQKFGFQLANGVCVQISIAWDDKTYVYDPNRIDVKTAIVIKGHTGWGLKSWADALEDADPLAVQALLWAVKQQNSEPCAIGELNFGVVEFLSAFMAGSLVAVQAAAAAEEAKTVDPTTSTSGRKPRGSNANRTSGRTSTSAV